MSATTPANPVAGPAQPPGFRGLHRWTAIRAAVPVLLLVAGVWTFTHPNTAPQTPDPPGAVNSSATVVDASDIVARPTEAPRETPAPQRHATPTPQAVSVAVPDVSTAMAEAPPLQALPPVPAVPVEPEAPPTPNAAALARQRRIDEDRAALDAPLVATPTTPAPAPTSASTDDAQTGYWLRRGMSIAATLSTSIDSTVPGLIVAYVADDVYDFTHAVIVIPRGAKLIGSFGGRAVGIAQGQARIPASFDSIQLADRVVALGDEPGIDRAGTTGLGARVDRHTRDTIASFAILAGVGLVAHGNSCTNCEQSGASNVGGTIVSAGTPFLPQPNAIQPTLHVAEGAQIAVMLTHDIPIKAWVP